MSVSTRLFQRIDSSTQSGVVLCGYSLIWVITPVCCLEAVMAASDVVIVGVVAAVSAADTGLSSSSIDVILRNI